MSTSTTTSRSAGLQGLWKSVALVDREGGAVGDRPLESTIVVDKPLQGLGCRHRRVYSRGHIAEPPHTQARRAGSPSRWGESAGVPAVAVLPDREPVS